LYAICGFASEIHKNDLVDSFEKIDLTTNSPWINVHYKNVANVDMKLEYTGIMPITPCQIFIYGGFLYRSVQRTMVIYDLIKNELLGIDERILEELRKQFLNDPDFGLFFDNYYEKN